MFVNRKNELSLLRTLSKKDGLRLLIVYGRRRIGKTELLKQFSQNKKHLFFSSDLSSEREQLRQFSQKVYTVTGDSFLKDQTFDSWEAAFRYVFDHFTGKVPIVIIDEFPYLCYSNVALPSILQKIWDEKVGQAKLMLVLCGSYMSFMEKEILAHKSPLFGRRTGQLVMEPLNFEEAQEFFPRYSKRDRVCAYAILGGTPAYLQRFSDKKSIKRNVIDEILNRNALLYEEPRFLLMEELKEPPVYFSILNAIAFGKTRLNEIVLYTGIPDRHKVNKYISVLRELGIVRRKVPVTEKKPHKSRKGIYILEDPYFRFWYRYVYPNFSYLEEGDVDYVWSARIKPDLDQFVSLVFEEICSQRLKQVNRAGGLPFKAIDIGPWWDGKDEIDIIALDREGRFLFCECKWSRRKVGLNLLEDLERKSRSFMRKKKCFYGFFSKSGFTKDLIETARSRHEVILFQV